MFDFMKQWLESTLGKSLLALASVFAAGAVAMAKLPDYVVSPRNLDAKVEPVRADLDRVKVAQEAAQRALEAQVINLRIDLLKQQRRQLLSKSKRTPEEESDLKEIDEDIASLRKKLEHARV